MQKRLLVGIGTLMTLGLIIGYYIHFAQTPRDQTEYYQEYEYYRIVDQENGKTLMTISSSPVSKGDELITEDNRLYKVVRVRGNIAYAKFVEEVDLGES